MRFTLAFLFLIFSVTLSLAEEPDQVVEEYYLAIKRGDVENIQELITGEFYKKKMVLLENNKKYPEFLRKHYQNAEARIIDTYIEGSSATVEVEINFKNGEISLLKMFLKETSQNSWKIFSERVVAQ
jgi:hypothetical protein